MSGLTIICMVSPIAAYALWWMATHKIEDYL
jgi:hypothetical protein